EVEEFDLLDQAVVRLLADQIPDLRVIEGADADRRPGLAVIAAPFEEVDSLPDPVVDPQELRAPHDRPRHRVAPDPQICLDVVEELEGILARAVTLVDE